MKAIGQAGIICRSNLTSSAGPQTQQLHEHECAEYARTIRFRSAGVGWLGWVPRHASIPQLPNINVPNIVFSSLTILTILHPFITEAFFCTQVINKAIIGLLPAPSFVLLCQLLVSTVVPKALSSLGWIEVDALEWGKVRRFSIIAATVLITMYCNIQVTKRNAVCLPKWRLVSGWLHGRHCTCDVAIYMTALLKFSSACRAHAWLQCGLRHVPFFLLPTGKCQCHTVHRCRNWLCHYSKRSATRLRRCGPIRRPGAFFSNSSTPPPPAAVAAHVPAFFCSPPCCSFFPTPRPTAAVGGTGAIRVPGTGRLEPPRACSALLALYNPSKQHVAQQNRWWQMAGQFVTVPFLKLDAKVAQPWFRGLQGVGLQPENLADRLLESIDLKVSQNVKAHQKKGIKSMFGSWAKVCNAHTTQSNCKKKEHVSHPGLQHIHASHKYLNHPTIYKVYNGGLQPETLADGS
eukprot:1144227-Pelagomonas_calceolata.AAC.1